jgi:hypothetical protein
MAGQAFLVVRSVVADQSLRAKFERWYSTDHLPRAIAAFKAEKGWRFWSETDVTVHYAVYRFADMGALRAAMASQPFRALVADYDRTWPTGVTRTREILNLAEELAAVRG